MPKVNKTQQRLLVLYAFHKIGKKISREQIAPLLLETTPLNWIEVQQTISSLIKDSLLSEEDEAGRVEINFKGEQVINVTKRDLSKSQKSNINNYLTKHKDYFLQEIDYIANFKRTDSGYRVHLSLSENNISMMDLYLTLPTRNLAQEVCNQWNHNCVHIYKDLIESLSKKRT